MLALLLAAFIAALHAGILFGLADLLSVYFAGTSHTTLGYGDIVLRKPWRSLGPISAISGLLTFGCSTAFLFLVLQDIWRNSI